MSTDRKEYLARYQRAHLRESCEKVKRYYLRNRNKVKKRAREYYLKNREKCNAIRKQWRHDNPTMLAAQAHRRRENAMGVESADKQCIHALRQLVNSQPRLKCAICNRNMPKGDRTIDHIIPLARGGSGLITNLQIVHRSCNSSKGAKLPHEITGQYEINFAGNGAHPNNRRGEMATSKSAFKAKNKLETLTI